MVSRNIIYPYRGPNIAGMKFGKLVALTFDLIERKWVCRCDCGAITKQEANRLISGHVKSCSSTCFWKSESKSYIVKEILRVYKRRHKFNLSLAFFEKIITQRCSYCGIAPCRVKKRNENVFYYNGIDRIDSSKGYVIDNVVPCCTICNVAKNDYTLEEFVGWIKNINTVLQLHSKLGSVQ